MKQFTNNGSWYLDRQLQEQWWQLEQALILLYQAVLTLRPEFLHPLEFQPFRLPSQWNYRKTHESERLARIRVLNSRNAFIPLIALCAYAVSLSQGKASSERRSDLNWISLLVDRYRIHPEWINELLDSPFFAMGSSRVGVYVNLENFNYPHILDHYIIYGVPVFIRVPSSVPSHIPKAFHISMQDKFDLQARNQLHLPQQQQQQQQQRGVVESTSNIPPSRTIPGETIQDFIERNMSLNERTATFESESARSSRVDRERHAALFECPGAKGAYVFEWVEDEGRLKRTYVPRNNVPEVWDSYTDSQRWYNSFRDEWDLCISLDPDAVHHDYNIDEQFDSSSAQDDPFQQISDDIGRITQKDMEAIYHDSPPVSQTITVPNLDDVLYWRYGFHPDGNRYQLPNNMLDPGRVAKALVEETLDIATNKPAVICFVSHLASTNSSIIPVSLSDTQDDNLYCLRSHKSKAMRIEEYSVEQFAISFTHIPDRILQLPYPSSALEALRLSSVQSVEDLARHFISQGTWCHLGQSLTGSVSPFHNFIGPNTGLGFRPLNFNPGWIDYQAYVRRRNALLRDPSVVRAALQMGGIIWRLTVDSISDNYGDLDFSRFFGTDIDHIRLTNHDLGIIVGLYLIWTGEI